VLQRADSSSDHDSEKRDKLFELPDISQLKTSDKRGTKQVNKKSPDQSPESLQMQPRLMQQVSTQAVINLRKSQGLPKRHGTQEFDMAPKMFLDDSIDQSIEASKMSSVSGAGNVSLTSWDKKYSKDEQDYLNKIAAEALQLKGIPALAYIIKKVVIAK